MAMSAKRRRRPAFTIEWSGARRLRYGIALNSKPSIADEPLFSENDPERNSVNFSFPYYLRFFFRM